MANLRLLGFNSKGELLHSGTSDNGIVGILGVGTTSSFSVLNKASLDSLLTLIDGSDISGSLHHHDNRYLTKAELQEIAPGNTGAHKITAFNPFLSTVESVQDVLAKIHTDLTALASVGMDWQNSVRDKDLTSPPLSPTTGDRYLIGTNPFAGAASGAWLGKDAQIAVWSGAIWTFTPPEVGMFLTADDEPQFAFYYNGFLWENKSFESTTASGFLQITAGDVQLRNLNAESIIVGNASNIAIAVDTPNVGEITATVDGLLIKDDVIYNKHINLNAGIETQKLQVAPPSSVLVWNSEGSATVCTPTGDIAVSPLGALTVKSLAIKTFMVDWGFGAGQINDAVIPAGATVSAYTGGASLRNHLLGIDSAFATLQATDANQAIENLTFVKLNGTRPMTGSLNLNDNNITNIAAARLDTITDKSSNAAITLSTSTEIGLHRKIVFTGTAKKIENLADGTLTTDASTFGQLSTVNTTLTNTKVSKSGDNMTGALAMGSNKITGLANGTIAADAINFGQLSTAETNLNNSINLKLNKAGDNMTGALVMGTNKITSLASGTVSTDAINLGQLTAVQSALDLAKVNRAGDTMTGALAMSSSKITGLGNGTSSNDAINLGQLVASEGTINAAIALKVNKAGDTMTGVLNMSSNKVTNLSSGTVASDAINFGQLSSLESALNASIALKFDKAGGTITGAVAMSSFKITGLGTGTAGTDAINLDQLTSAQTALNNSIALKVSKAGDTMTGALAMSNNKVTGLANGTVTADAVNFGQLDTVNTTLTSAVNTKLTKAGDTMSGVLNMGTNKISNLANGTLTADAVNFGQLSSVDSAKVNRAGDAMTGALAMGSNKITGLANGTAAADAVNFSQLSLKIDLAQKAAANGVATLGADGKIPSAQLPAIAITDTFVVASQVAMLALVAETGDVAVRTDLNKSYILRGSSPSILGDWQELLTPTDLVLSVNGFTGAVVLTTDNVSQGSTNKYYSETLFNASLASKTTDSLAQGATNKYYATSLFNTDLATKTTDNLAQGAINKYYASSLFNADLATKSTTNLIEGSNLYFTDARARLAAVVDSIAGGETNIAPSVASAKAYIDGVQSSLSSSINTKVSKSGDSMTGALSMGSNKITNLANGTSAADVVNFSQLSTKLDASLKGAANGLAELDATGRVPSSQTALSAFTKVYQVADIAARDTLVGIKESDIVRVADNGSGNPEAFAYTGSIYVSLGGAGLVLSVNSLIGDVVLTTDEITEGANLYYTSSRFDTAFAVKTTDGLAQGSINKYYATSLFNADLAAKTTDNVAEGILNKYYTDARFGTSLSGRTTDDLAQGTTNKYYSTPLFDSDFAGKFTTSLAEGTNLYFTTTRARTAAVINSVAGNELDQAPSVAAIKTYIAQEGSSKFKNQVFVLTNTNLANGYVDLDFEARHGSVMVFFKGGIPQIPGEDFTLSVENTVTRVTLDSSLLALLDVGDKLVVYYAHS
jgi:hypothetical protein